MFSRLLEAGTVVRWSLALKLQRRRRRISRPVSSRHLLIVSWDFPPSTATAAQVPAFLARHAARKGWRVTVLCGPVLREVTERGKAAVQLLPAEVRTVRAAGWFDGQGEFHPAFFHKLSPVIDGGFAQTISLAHSALAALRDDPPTHVFATGPVFANFLVGRRLAEHFDVPLCLQYRDEWTVMKPSFVGGSNADREIEQSCLERADLVTFVTTGKAEVYRQSFPLLNQRQVLVSPNGWDPEVFAAANAPSQHLASLAGRIVLTFTGRVTEEIPIEPFLDTVAAALAQDPALARRLTLLIIGDQTDLTRQQLAAFEGRCPGILDVRAGMPQQMAIQVMRESSALLLLNNTRYAGVVPLKTFDYMASGTPILAYGSMGMAGAIVRESGAGVVVSDNDATELQAAIAALGGERRAWQTAARDRWCQQNNRESLANELLERIGQLAPGQRGETAAI